MKVSLPFEVSKRPYLDEYQYKVSAGYMFFFVNR